MFKHYVMLASFTDSSRIANTNNLNSELSSSSPVSVVNNRGWDCREVDFQWPGQQGLVFPGTVGKGLAGTVLTYVQSQLAFLGCLVYVDQHHQQ